MHHADGRTTVVAVHAGETIGPGLLLKILRDAEMTKEDILKARKKRARPIYFSLHRLCGLNTSQRERKRSKERVCL